MCGGGVVAGRHSVWNWKRSAHTLMHPARDDICNETGYYLHPSPNLAHRPSVLRDLFTAIDCIVLLGGGGVVGGVGGAFFLTFYLT